MKINESVRVVPGFGQKFLNVSAIVALASALLIAGCAMPGKVLPMTKTQLQDKMQPVNFKSANNITIPCRVYVPAEAMAPVARKVPLVLWLHGAGQRGKDNTQQLDSGAGSIMSIVTEESGDYTSMVIAPQCPEDAFWRDEQMLKALHYLIDYVIDRFPGVDPDRVCIAGYSMGGDAAWKMLISYPDDLAVIVPICGGPLQSMEPDNPIVPDKSGKVKVWAFNNMDDTIVRPRYARRVLSQLWQKNDGDGINFTISMTGGHDASNIIDDRKLLIWMLSAKRQ